MKIKWGTVWLVEDAAPAFDIRFSGKQVVQEAQLLRAEAADFRGRGNRSASLSFATITVYSTIQAAEEFLATHYDSLENQSTLLLRIGTPSEGTKDVTCDDAVLVDVSFQQVGVSITTRYSFLLQQPVAAVTTPPDDELESGTADIPSGQDYVDVTGLGLSSTPDQIFCTVRKPLNGYTFCATVDASTVTTDGFRAYLNGETPDGSYDLDWAIVP